MHFWVLRCPALKSGRSLQFSWNIASTVHFWVHRCFAVKLCRSLQFPWKIGSTVHFWVLRCFAVKLCGSLQFAWKIGSTMHFFGTVEPVFNGPVLSHHPLVSRQFSKSRFFAHTDPVFVTCIMRPPCSRPWMSHSDDTRVLLGIFCFILFAMTN